MSNGGRLAQAVGSVTMLDSDFSNTPIGILTAHDATSQPPAGGSLILENIRITNVGVAVQGSNDVVALPGSAKGDGHSDDTEALQQAILVAKKQQKILYLDHGDYLVSSTIHIPAESRIVGESYSVILSYGQYFNDWHNPQPVVQIGKPGETGSIEWSDTIVSTRGQQRGAVLFEYNLQSSASHPSGLWDVHARVGGFAGSDQQLAQYPTTPDVTITAQNLDQNAIAAFTTMHVTKSSTGLYLENVWLWTADHDVEDSSLTQITIYAARGLLVESEAGPTWLVGTSVEHFTLYQYQFLNTKNVFAGQVSGSTDVTETIN
nr:glucan 1,3-beta-glucosidase [Quercus suber]